MRVITGKYKGRKLETPVGNAIRPTSDKVKESIFNLLMEKTYGRTFCDLFAGTGSLGIEALSRGARRCYFCDHSRESIRLIRRNLIHCGAENEARIIQGDYQKALAKIIEPIDVFILDPPYQAGLYESCLERIENLDLLRKDGIIVAEHDSRQLLPERWGSLTAFRRRKYGKTTLTLYCCDTTAREQKEEE